MLMEFSCNFFHFLYFQEFHATAGSKINVQTPLNFLSKQAFDLINAYILPKRELERQVLTVNTLSIKIVGFPIKIKHSRYARNAFYFNLCFVCDHFCRYVNQNYRMQFDSVFILPYCHFQECPVRGNRQEAIRIFNYAGNGIQLSIKGGISTTNPTNA